VRKGCFNESVKRPDRAVKNFALGAQSR